MSYRRTLKMFEDALRPRTPIVVAPPTDFDDPGSWIMSGGITLGSIILSESALFRASHPFITDTLNSLATLLIHQKKFDEAEKYLKRAQTTPTERDAEQPDAGAGAATSASTIAAGSPGSAGAEPG